MQMQKLKCAHKNVAAAQNKKKKKKPKRASRHFVNIITTFFAIYLYYLRVCVCECVGCAGYFIIFAGCMIINLHLNHRHRRPCRRPCRADDWPVQVLLFFSSCLALFFRAVVVPAVHFLGTPADGVCVCLDIHTTLLTTKCHMILC